MDTCLLDVLHHRGDMRLTSVAERIDVDLDRVLDEPVEQHASLHMGRHRGADLLGRVADPHRPPAQHVRGPDQHGVADPLRDPDGLLGARGRPPLRAADAEPLEQRAEALAVLGQVDRLVRRAHQPVAGLLQRRGELQRSLAAELGHDADGTLAFTDREHLLDSQRLEVEPVGGVVVGRDRLRVAVHHHRLVAERPEALRRVDTAVVELDPLPDPVRPGAQDHHRVLLSSGGLVQLPQVE